MKRFRKPYRWTLGVVALALLSFFTGTSIACFQRIAGSVTLAEACCKGRCQHVMTDAAATECCQHHHVSAAQAIPASIPSPVAFFAASAFLSSIVLTPEHEGSWRIGWRSFPTEQPPTSPPLYALHCTLLR